MGPYFYTRSAAAAATIILEDESWCQPLHHASVHCTTTKVHPPSIDADAKRNEPKATHHSPFNLFHATKIWNLNDSAALASADEANRTRRTNVVVVVSLLKESRTRAANKRRTRRHPHSRNGRNQLKHVTCICEPTSHRAVLKKKEVYIHSSTIHAIRGYAATSATAHRVLHNNRTCWILKEKPTNVLVLSGLFRRIQNMLFLCILYTSTSVAKISPTSNLKIAFEMHRLTKYTYVCMPLYIVQCAPRKSRDEWKSAHSLVNRLSALSRGTMTFGMRLN